MKDGSVHALLIPSEGFPDITDRELLWRAVKNCRSRAYRKGEKHWRWIAVKDTFLLGSTYSRQLCARFNLDPDEKVSR